MGTIETAAVPLHYDEHPAAPDRRVEGVQAIVVHGLAPAPGSGPTPDDTAASLAAAGIRSLTYDRRGYGRSGAPEPYTATTVDEQGNDLMGLIGALGAAPALLVGEGFGALVVLDVVLRRPALVHAAVLADIPLYAFVPAATELLARQRLELERAVGEGQPPAGLFADFAGIASLAFTRRDLREIATPLAVVTRPDSPPELQEASDRLAELVPDARRARDGEVVALARLLA